MGARGCWALLHRDADKQILCRSAITNLQLLQHPGESIWDLRKTTVRQAADKDGR